MKKKFITDAVETVISGATEISFKNNQNWCNTGHLFWSLMKFLSNAGTAKTFSIEFDNGYHHIVTLSSDVDEPKLQNLDGEWVLNGKSITVISSQNVTKCTLISEGKNDKTYAELADKFNAILSKYDITYLNYKYCFNIANPVGKNEIENSITIQPDLKNLIKQLQDRFLATRTVQDIPQLIEILFTSEAYDVRKIFDFLSTSMFDEPRPNFNVPKNFKPAAFYNDVIALIREINKTTYVKTIEQLDQIAELNNLNKLVSTKNLKYADVDDTIEKMEVSLNSDSLKSFVLVGPAGCGKTSKVWELADRINKQQVSERLKNITIYELSISKLVSGCTFRGSFEEKVENILTTVSKYKDAVLFIDEGHTLISAGASSSSDGGDTSFGNIIKTYLDRGDVSIITATTDTEYKYFEKDHALARRFRKISITEPNKEQTRTILGTVLPTKEISYGIKCDNHIELIDSVLMYGEKYVPGLANPARSTSLLDGAFAYAAKHNKKVLSCEDIISYIKLQYGLTITSTKADDTKKELLERILGQEKAIDKIHRALTLCELGIVDTNTPLYTMIMAGPTGVGKTASAKLIAKEFFGSEKNIVIEDMTRYSEQHSASGLFGTTPGYVGYDEETSFLKKVKNMPNCVVLFDEIEKAHENIFPTIMQILDEGVCEDNHGNVVSFKNTIIIFTTNLGFDHDSNKASGAGIIKTVAGTTNVIPMLKKAFKPEFLGRINDIITFDYLNKDVVNTIINRTAQEMLANSLYAKKHGTDIHFTEAEIKEITKLGNIEQEGARNLRHAVQKVLGQKIISENNKKIIIAKEQ